MTRVRSSSPSAIELATPRNDRGMQDLLAALDSNPARSAAEALTKEQRTIVVCTGFPAGGRPETDGPPGAFALIDALRSMKKDVKLASWQDALDIFGRIRADVQSIAVPTGVTGRTAGPPCALVTIEACGVCADGIYRNMHGIDISCWAPRFEDFFGSSSLVSVGDGGNEFGMGSAPKWFFAQKDILQPSSCSENLVPASVSNYGAYAIIRELEGLCNQILLPTSEEHIALITALVEAGCVDGYTGEQTLSVDGEDLGKTRDVLDGIRGASTHR